MRRLLPSEYLAPAASQQSVPSDIFEQGVDWCHAVMANVDLDSAFASMAASYTYDRLPVPNFASESHTNADVDLDSVSTSNYIRLRAQNIASISIDGENAILYHCMDNKRRYRDDVQKGIVFPVSDAVALATVLSSYPKAVRIGDLPMETDTDKIEIAIALLEARIVVVENGKAEE